MRNLFFIYFIFLSSINTILAQEKWIEHVSEEESSPRLIPIDDETFFLFSQLFFFLTSSSSSLRQVVLVLVGVVLVGETRFMVRLTVPLLFWR